MTDKPLPSAPNSTIVHDELAIALRTLETMVPQAMPNVEGIDMAALYRPAPGIGGTLYDVIKASDEQVVFIVFDVAARGVSAALMAAMAKVSFANHARLSSSPRAVIGRVNEEMTAYLTSPFFLSAFVAYLDLHDNKLTYCNAGCTPALLLRAGGTLCEELPASGSRAGVLDHEVYDEKSVHLQQGDWLLILNKGVLAVQQHPGNQLSWFVQQALKRVSTRSALTYTGWIDSLVSGAPKETDSEDRALIAIGVQTQSRRYLLKEQLGFAADEPVYLQLINYFEEMDAATAVILRAMDNQGYADDIIRKMKITLTELLVNALDHGNNRDPSRRVSIGHVVDNHHASIAIMDEGSGFNPAAVPDPTLPENLVKDSGRGLFIVNCYVDKVEFNENANRIKITKFFD